MSETFRIIIEDDYRAGKGFEAVINQTGVVKVALEGVNAAGQRMAAQSEVSYEKMARGIWRVTSLFAVMDMAMMRVEVAQNILVSAQERYNQTLLKHGSSSREAAQAHRELERVNNYVARSYIRAGVSAGSFILQLLIQSEALKGATVASHMKALAEAKATFVSNLHNASLSTKIILLSALTAGVFAAAAAFGAMAGAATVAAARMEGVSGQRIELGSSGRMVMARSPVSFENTIIVERGTDVEEAIDANARRLKDEYRRRSAE